MADIAKPKWQGRAEAAESQLEMARKALVIANAQLADMEFLTVEGFLGWKKDRARLADGETKSNPDQE